MLSLKLRRARYNSVSPDQAVIVIITDKVKGENKQAKVN